jgi:ribonuclease P protein component
VVRNATRRRMREVMRSVWDRLPDGLDFLMIARARSATVSYQALNRTVMRLLHQAGWIHDLT